MDAQERAKIIAIARLAGVAGTDDEIFFRFWEEYQKILSEPVQPAKGVVKASPLHMF